MLVEEQTPLEWLYIKLAAQLCSTCFASFVGAQHVLHIVGVGAKPPRRTTSATSSARSTSSRDRICMLEAAQPPALEDPRRHRRDRHRRRRRRTDEDDSSAPEGSPFRSSSAAAPSASPITRILRAACFSEIAFSLTGAVTTAVRIHDPTLVSNFHLTFWAQGPHWGTQVASFCWMGALAMYIAKRNRVMFDVLMAHVIIWLLAVFFWVLVLYAAYHDRQSSWDAATFAWMGFVVVNIAIVSTCWARFARRWRGQDPARRRGSYVVAKLLSYTLAFLVCVLPYVIYNIVQGCHNPCPIEYAFSSLLALWPTANAIIYLTKPTMCLRWFRDSGDGAFSTVQRSAGGVALHGGAVGSAGDDDAIAAPYTALPRRAPGDVGMHHQILMSPTQHELKGLEIGDKIGEGVAVVYHGKWRGADVAVKMKSLMIDRSEDLKEFQDACNLEIQQEAAVMKTLCHPNIVLFMEAGFYKGSICIISEYCARGSLRDVLMRANVTQLSWSTKLRLALGIAHGIQYLHNSNPPMIHRDLKSPNVLVDDSWHAKIADFGTLRFAEIVSGVQHSQSRQEKARRASNRASRRQENNSKKHGSSLGEGDAMVMTGLVGTTRWMAPEVIRGDKIYTNKADIYSLGLIFWELIEGRLPFESTRWNHEIEGLVLQGMRPAIRTELCPERWKLLVATCWQSDPTVRPTISQVITSLQRIAREEALDTSAPRFTGMSSQFSVTQSVTSDSSLLDASVISEVSTQSIVTVATSPASQRQHRRRRLKRSQLTSSRAARRAFRASYLSVDEESEVGASDSAIEDVEEDEDAGDTDNESQSAFFVHSGNFIKEPTTNLADSRIDEIPPPLRLQARGLSGDVNAMVSI
ncbi:hypothetical protein P43SY_005904 [Pythium insidiosum]|uniref:Protein kinase domain-containing protein n=1 Tax=Pythium insidiosum TaxID=114742 RepID=A0AAD5MCN0_PYTIN|nr:hypothetical protein P43SY_005904 [Pythium insidiosum]